MKQILCFGDSNTYGLVPKEEARYPWDIRWTGILEERIREKGYRVIEEGLCGRTTVFEDPLREGRRGTAVLPAILETHAPVELVILMLGTNDCKSVYAASPEVIGKGIEKLLDQIRQKLPESKVLLISPIRLGEKVWKEEYDPEFNQESVETARNLPAVYERIAKERGIYYLAASDYAAPSRKDQEHLDPAGHGRLAEGIGAFLEEIL